MTAEEIVVLIVLVILICTGSFLYGHKCGKQDGKDELMKDLVYIWKNIPEFIFERGSDNDKRRTEESPGSVSEVLREGL